MIMPPKQQGIHALRLNRSSRHRSLFKTTRFEIHATLGCSIISKHIVVVHTSSLYENASNTTRHSCFTLESVVQAYEFVQTTRLGIHATLGCPFIPKHIVVVHTSYLYENASKTTRHHALRLNRSSKLRKLFKLLV